MHSYHEPEKRTRARLYNGVLYGICGLAMLIAICIVLHYDPGDCMVPMRTWLKGEGVISAFYLVLGIGGEAILIQLVKDNRCLLTLYSIIVGCAMLFSLVWWILGNVWFFSAEKTCEYTFYFGYQLTEIIIIVTYCFVGLSCLCCCCCLLLVLCVGKK